ETLLRRDLAVAAFAMFNRGQQFITEADLDKDLSVLSPAEPAAVRASFGQPVSRARRTVAAFFFVHVAQADEHDADRARRTFEFLHATFGEYLVAEYSVELLQEVAAELEFQRTRAFGGRPDDRAFRALLSHQPLLKRWPVVEFVRHMVMEQSALRDACLELLATSRSRGAVDGLEAYEPSPFDSVARLAAYSVNLVTLACICACGWGWPSIADLSRGADWESTVRLWRAGLDRQGQVAVMGTLIRTDDDRVELTGTGTDSIEANTARLVQDRLTDLRLRSGGLLWWSAMPPTPGQLEVHVDVVAMLADRWPVPILDHLTLPDEDRYRRLAEATRTVIMAPDTARCLLKLLIDDGPRLPREVVTPLAKAAVAAWIGDPPVLLPALIVRCPYLIDDLPWEPEGAGAPISPLSLLLLLRGLERLPRRQRPSLAGVAESAAMALIAEDFKPEQSTIEMVDWAVSAGLSGSAVSGLLRAFETYGAAVWKQISHRQMAALVRRADDVPDKLLEGYRACHSCPAGPDAKDLDAKDLSILGYR
ncbi:MAG TPA: hypothetical protein VF062_24880, partial [Candidatus Limnocylindrales bacterium]